MHEKNMHEKARMYKLRLRSRGHETSKIKNREKAIVGEQQNLSTIAFLIVSYNSLLFFSVTVPSHWQSPSKLGSAHMA